MILYYICVTHGFKPEIARDWTINVVSVNNLNLFIGGRAMNDFILYL